jgi:hypothetical protein
MGRERGYVVSGLASLVMFMIATVVGVWRMKRYPDDPWKFRL